MRNEKLKIQYYFKVHPRKSYVAEVPNNKFLRNFNPAYLN